MFFSLLFVFSHAALALLIKTAKLGSLCETNLAFCIIIFKLKGIAAGEGSEKTLQSVFRLETNPKNGVP